MALTGMEQVEPITKYVVGEYDYSCQPNGQTYFDPLNSNNITIPTGYTAMAIAGYVTNSTDILVANCMLSGAYGVVLKNLSSAIVSKKFQYRVLCVKTEYQS